MKRLILSLLALTLAACGSSGSTGDQNGLSVVATTSVLGDLTRGLVGDDAHVDVLIEAGVDPHLFSPSPSQISLLQAADLVVANGLGLEAGIERALDSAAEDGVVVLELAERLDPLPFGGPHGHADETDEEHVEHTEDHDHADDDADDDAHEHDHGDLDPHFVLDPLRMADAADLIAAALAEIDSSVDWEERAADIRTELERLHSDIEAELDAVPSERRKLVTNHEALGYFADRYGFEVVGTVIPGGSTMAEPSASDLAELVETIRSHGVEVIFIEWTASESLAETVASELAGEVEVLRLHTESLGPEGSGADTYEGMMRTNASTIASALGD